MGMVFSLIDAPEPARGNEAQIPTMPYTLPSANRDQENRRSPQHEELHIPGAFIHTAGWQSSRMNGETQTQEWRVIRESLESRNSHLEEQNRSLMATANLQAVEYHALVANIAERDAESEKLREETAKLTRKVKSLKQELQSAQQVSDQWTDEVEKLRLDNDELNHNLEACKDRIFRMQPPKVVSDAEISDAYAALCRAVGEWVATGVEELDDDFLGKRFQMTLDENTMLSLVRVAEGHRYGSAETLLVQCHVFKLIYEFLLDPQRIWPGLSKDQDTFLNVIIQGLEKVKPFKGECTHLLRNCAKSSQTLNQFSFGRAIFSELWPQQSPRRTTKKPP
jgi:predicted  nucleic acid-binding Zn-ribbon protein